MSPRQSTTPPPPPTAELRGDRVVLDALVEQGVIWARHGLHAGRAALETSSRATGALAESLAKLADSLERPSSGETPAP